MAKDDELKQSVKDLVKELVSDTVSKLVKASAQKTVTGLRDRLKEEAAKRVEDKLRKTAKQLQKELNSDTAEDTKYVAKLKEAFEERFQKLLTSLSKGPLQPLIIASACTLVLGGFIGWIIVDHFIEPTPTPPQPDLVISAITFDIEPTSEEEFAPATTYNVTIHYVIENQGGVEAGASTTHFYFLGEPLMASVGPLYPGEAREELSPIFTLPEENIYPYMSTYGYVYLELCADAGNIIEESNEENNCVTIESTWPVPTPPPQPDLVITDIYYISSYIVIPETDLDSYPTYPTYSLTFCYVIKNQGEAEAGESYTRMAIFEGPSMVDEVAPLGPGEEREEFFTAYTPENGDANYNMLCVDIYGDVDESNEENNCASMADLQYYDFQE